MINITGMAESIPASAIPKLDSGTVNSILGNVAASARNRWLRLGGADESSFSGDYVRGILPTKVKSETEHVITLVGEVPHLLEDGAPRLDMRTTLLGPNVPVVPIGERGKHRNKKGGYFRAIPIRHKTPTAKSPQTMGAAYSGHKAVSDSKALGRSVYRAAKALEGSKTDPYGKTKWGGRLKTKGMGVPLLRKHHKSNIYEGMVRQEKTYEKATQSQYVTFRTISTSVQDGSWWRKAITPRRYAVDVSNFAAELLPRAFGAYLEGQ